MDTRRCKAFTMIELLVTIMVILLVAVMLIPFLGGIGSDQAVSAANQFQAYLSLARQYAVGSHRDTALFVIRPSADGYMNSTRLIIFQLKEGGDGTKGSDWQTIPGALGLEMPENVKIVNGVNYDMFYVWYSGDGTIADACPDSNLTIRIGPRNSESRIRTIQYAIARQVGSLVRFNDETPYID